MSDMKCPICGKDLVEIEFGKRWFLACDNSKCRCKGVASYVIWEFLTVAIKNRKALSQEIIHTGKALDIAVDVLKSMKTDYDDSYADPHFVNWHIVAQRLANDANDAIKEISATHNGIKHLGTDGQLT